MGHPLPHSPGDVLLVRNESSTPTSAVIGWLIRTIDDSPFTHSALVVGDGELSHISPGNANENAADDSEITSLARFTDPDGTYTRAESYTPTDATPSQLAAAVTHGRELAARDIGYGHAELFLCGALLLRRRVPWWARPFAGPICSAAAALIDHFGNPHPDEMICSEYVYGCLEAAGVDLLPDGLSAAPSEPRDGFADTTLGEWLDAVPAPVGEAPQPFTFEGIDTLDTDLERALRATDPYDLIDTREPPAGPETELDADVVVGVRGGYEALRSAWDRSARPTPNGVADPGLISPGDLLRGGAVTFHGRWDR